MNLPRTFSRFKLSMFPNLKNAGAIRLYLHLQQRDPKRTGCVQCGYKVLADDLYMSVRVIAKRLKQLQKMHLVHLDYSNKGYEVKIYFDPVKNTGKDVVNIPSDMVLDITLPDKEVLLYALYTLFSQKTGSSEIDQKTLARIAGCHRDTISWHTLVLVERGFLSRQDRRNERLPSLTVPSPVSDLYYYKDDGYRKV